MSLLPRLYLIQSPGDFQKEFFSKLPGDLIKNYGYFSRVFSKLPGDLIKKYRCFLRAFTKLPGDFIENYGVGGFPRIKPPENCVPLATVVFDSITRLFSKRVFF